MISRQKSFIKNKHAARSVLGKEVLVLLESEVEAAAA